MAFDPNQSDQRMTKVVVHHILIVEDNPDEAQALKAILEKKGYQASIAKDGGQAHSSFVMHKPDFVILDLILPGETGFEVCEHFKKTDANVPILILSAMELTESRNLAQRVGCDAYLTKPYEPENLLKLISQIAEKNWRKTHLGTNSERESGDYVRFSCLCGKRLKVSAAHRGKSLTCSNCGELVTVPRH